MPTFVSITSPHILEVSRAISFHAGLYQVILCYRFSLASIRLFPWVESHRPRARDNLSAIENISVDTSTSNHGQRIPTPPLDPIINLGVLFAPFPRSSLKTWDGELVGYREYPSRLVPRCPSATCAAALSCVTGVPFTSLAQVLPFILVGIGVDDMVGPIVINMPSLCLCSYGRRRIAFFVLRFFCVRQAPANISACFPS